MFTQSDSDKPIPKCFCNFAEVFQWLCSKWSVTVAISLFGLIIIIWGIFICHSIKDIANNTAKITTKYIKLESKAVELTLSETQLQEFKQSIDFLTQKVNSLETLLQETKTNLTQSNS
ncbi:hypothetical protein PCC7424_1399 [Gloeothece citriformis PCC 7424]|uniref:Uncharacterized protein n=1 Tax=Gloeothece citriformis (strain PCC 7424) TaxID=65393 RepID=B7K883_GLOC7|nr:hypothetical protein [Gloeothece citriformis]ACK69843.1 hypothetical protein PCC7424_1399 [Gloeothece citriformis PCC 7424]